MEQLTYNAKIAVLKVLYEILNADNVIHKNEIQYIKEVIKDFGLSDDWQKK